MDNVYFYLLKLFSYIQNLFLKFNLFISLSSNKKEINNFVKLLKDSTYEFDLIRIGHNKDGGYLIPDDLKNINACMSAGVGGILSFENELYKLFGIKSHTIDIIDYSKIIDNKYTTFLKKKLCSINNSNCTTLEKWMNSLSLDTNDLILQMDIERSEYEVLIETDKKILNKFRIIIIEFHDLFFLANKLGYSIIKSIFSKILSQFNIVHIHPNNNSHIFKYGNERIPHVLEITFLRKDRFNKIKNKEVFNSKEDYKNNPNKRSINLDNLWNN